MNLFELIRWGLANDLTACLILFYVPAFVLGVALFGEIL